MKLVNLSNGQELASKVDRANTFLKRLRGLMFSKEFNLGAGLHITPCRSVHTYFMNYAIDVLFVNERLEVVGTIESMPPRRVSRIYRSAMSVIELPAGTVQQSRTEIGQTLKLLN